MTSNCQCGSHPPAKPQAVELEKLEAVLADCRARKASAKPGTPALIACLSEKLTDTAAVKNAVQARLDAGRAKFAAVEAQVRAKAAAAAVQPALTTAAQFAAPRLQMTRAEFSKLSAADRARFVREGGKIVD